MQTMLFCILILCVFSCANAANKVIYAVNAGGQQHTDANGIKYLADPLSIGVESNYGTRFPIRRIPQHDHILYQTERWHDSDFSYDAEIKQDGDYVLVLKFAEVYFSNSNSKVFDVQLNKRHTVLKNLDIFEKVGHSTAHDVVIPFTVRNGKLSVVNEFSTFNDILTVEFKKGAADNPKICAFYIMEGVPEDVPSLPPLKEFDPASTDFDDNTEEDEDDMERPPKKESADRKRLKSGPPAVDPYAEDGSSLVMPVMIAIGLFIPTLLCLCRL